MRPARRQGAGCSLKQLWIVCSREFLRVDLFCFLKVRFLFTVKTWISADFVFGTTSTKITKESTFLNGVLCHYFVLVLLLILFYSYGWTAWWSLTCTNVPRVTLCLINKEDKDLQVQATVSFMFFGLFHFHNGWAANKRLADLCVSSAESEIDGLKKAATSYRTFHKASSATEQVHSDKCSQEPARLLASSALS